MKSLGATLFLGVVIIIATHWPTPTPQPALRCDPLGRCEHTK